ncbi:MAG: cytochrome c oxidase subunit 2 [Gammaproteobacteria bacterium]|nr:cytochrome c oxidase subunit 2 [Gammaproteobacteria bacterium]
MSRIKSVLFAGLSLASVGLLSMRAATAGWALNLPPPVSPVGSNIASLHNAILIICVVIFAGVFAVMFYSIFAHRKSRGAQPAQFSHNTAVEFVWSAIPAIILVGMAIPSTATLIDMENTEQADMSVKITGYQWLWEYEYLDHDVSYYSRLATPSAQINNQETKNPHYLLEVDEPLVLPVDKKIRFMVTAADVIHAWWMPELGVKKDAIPGYVNETWALIEKEGTYRGQCAELCGKDHGFMPIVVKAVSQEAFDAWIASKQSAARQDVESGGPDPVRVELATSIAAAGRG